MPAYADKLQDWRAWLQEGILDLNVPMAYFDRTVHARAWERWSAFARTERAGRHLALGVGAYLNAPAHTLEQIASAGEAGPETGPAEGVVCYSYAAPARPAADGPALLEALTAPAVGSRPGGPFARPAVPPAMGWKAAPSLGHCQGTVRGPDATPLEAATLELAGPVRRDLPADGNGWFGAVGLPPGRYRLRASAPGLEFRSAWCEIVPGETAEQDFTLAPPLGEDF
jgi:hypothetical protein